MTNIPVFSYLVMAWLQLLRGMLTPFVKIFSFGSVFLRKRLDFEQVSGNRYQSFSLSGKTAHYCFEVSSEGELEQVYSLVELFLSEGLLVEIIYSSPSVDHRCQNLFENYPNQIRLLRLPLLSSPIRGVSSWVTSKNVIFCRYDFFPELLLLKSQAKLILLSACLKTKKKTFFKRAYWKLIYPIFDYIVSASEVEQERFEKELRISTDVAEFRFERIADRVQRASNVIESDPLLKMMKSYYDSTSTNIVFGSCWEVDLSLLNHVKLQENIFSGKWKICLVPHLLDHSSLKTLQESLSKYDLQALVVEKGSDMEGADGKVIILNKKGVLAEVYQLFQFAYVGGGLGRSVHSLLEPYLSGCQVLCGPKVFRSTEYDLISHFDPRAIDIITGQGKDFFGSISENLNRSSQKYLELFEIERVKQNQVVKAIQNMV